MKQHRVRNGYASIWGFVLFLSLFVLVGCGGGGGGGGVTGGDDGTEPIGPTGELQVAISSVELVNDCEDIWVYFNAVGPDDNLVDNLSENDIALSVDGIEGVTFREFYQVQPIEETEISIVFILDYSLSMSLSMINAMQQAVEEFLMDMGVDDYGKIVKFAGSVFAASDLSNDKQELLDFLWAAVDESDRWGTNIYDAVYAAVEALKGAVTERVAIILLTDGDQNIDGDWSLDEAIENAKSTTSIHSIGLMDDDRYFDESDIKRMARETNGLYFRTTSGQLLDKYEQLTKILLFENNLVIFSSDLLSGVDPHRVKLSLSLEGLNASDEKEFLFDTVCR
jgi:hypothetical protein